MMDAVWPMILIAVVVLLVAAAIFAWRVRNGVLRWCTFIPTVLLAAVASALCVLAIAGTFKLHARTAPVPDLRVEGRPEQIRRGQAVADSFCGGCHSRDGTLTGGVDIGKDLPVRLGSFVSSNLTPAGSLDGWSDGDIFRAIRNSVDPDGRLLMIMSITNAGRLSDDDIGAVIAYIRHQPAAGSPTPDPPDRFNLLGLVMLGAGRLPPAKPVFAGVITAPHKGPSFEYGEYILSYHDCRACHGADLSGGTAGQLAPIGPGLDLVKNWSREEFIATMRTGKDPNGHELDELMPWRPIGRMDDDELGAVYEYLTHGPAPKRVRPRPMERS